MIDQVAAHYGGSGGLADVASAGQRLLWMFVVMASVVLVALSGTGLARRRR